jgi:NTE family protein
METQGSAFHDITARTQPPRRTWLDRLLRFVVLISASGSPPAHKRSATPPIAREKTVFVLLGGGSRGAAQAGALAAVLEQGIRPDLMIGVSAGAWNGAYLASDPIPERASVLCDLWAKTKTTDLLGGGWWQAAVSAVSGRPALYGSEGPVRMAHRYLPAQTFEELQVPLSIVASNLTTGQPAIFSSGRLLPAVLASSAVPGIFPPVVKDGQVYVDGGLQEWEASATALKLGAQRVYLFGCGAIAELSPRLIPTDSGALAEEHPGQPERDWRVLLHRRQQEASMLGANLLDVLERSWDVITRYQFRRSVESLRASGVKVISIDPELPPLSRPLDFNRGAAMIAAGRAAAETALRSEARETVDLASSAAS